MRFRLRAIAFVLAALFITAACTAEELALYLETTKDVRNVLSAAELGRLRECESTDDYAAISRGGTYRGAYQFDQTTWNDVAGRHFPWLVEIDPAGAAPWWQDAMARALWSERGKQPWPICGHRV